jgi:hypothetical protein
MISAPVCIFEAEMPGKSNHFNHHSLANRARVVRHLSPLAVLVLMLLQATQSLAFTSFQQGISNPFAIEKVAARPAAPDAVHVAAILPFESVPSGLEIEILEEAEIEDDLDEYWTHIVNAIYSNEQGYTNSVRSRLLHYHSKLHNRQTVPYFILYHSWKSYLA